MNARRRKAIEKIYNLLADQVDNLELLGEEEQEAYDNMPESLQDTERGERMYEAIDALNDAASDLRDIIDNLSELVEG